MSNKVTTSLINRQMILEAKVNLYRMILDIPPSELTQAEIQIGYWLAHDEGIQKILTKSLNKIEKE